MTETSKRCGMCGETKPLDAFNRYQTSSRPANSDGRQPRCRECSRASSRRWREANRELSRAKAREWNEAHPEYTREKHFQRRYGISLEEYDRMDAEQEGRCAICGKACRTGKRLGVDHCHETGDVRGLLCRTCNAGLGQFGDSLDMLRSAVEYLTKHEGGS